MEFNVSFNRMTRTMVDDGAFASSPLTLVDVGCSGGIGGLWRTFEPALRAVGVDPVIDECHRLTQREMNQAVQYLASFVGLPANHPFILKRANRDLWGANPFPRTSAAVAGAILATRVESRDKLALLNDWPHQQLADPGHLVTVDNIASEYKLIPLDFLKIDVDGHDLDVLYSAEQTIRFGPVLGLALEVNYIGGAAETDHSFHNTDRLMRQWGYDLFGLTSRLYSAAALPGPFEYSICAQTRFGRPVQGDALYLLDPIARPGLFSTLPVERLLKLACLFECFGLPDHAAELIASLPEHCLPTVSPGHLLDVLTGEITNSSISYQEYMERFENDPTSLYPGR